VPSVSLLKLQVWHSRVVIATRQSPPGLALRYVFTAPTELET
jgi:hypothetical protein